MTPAASPPALTDPYAIYSRARAYWEDARYPASVRFDVAVTVEHLGKTSQAHYHCYYDSANDKVFVSPTSDEELAHPYTPHGINFGFNLLGAALPLSAPQHTFDYLGVPVLAPNYSFGIAEYQPHGEGIDPAQLVNEIRREYGEGPKNAPPPAASTLPTIASVESVKRHYVISLDGMTQLFGHDDYQLALRPISNPGRYRLREVFVNAQTFATDRVMTDGNFISSGLTHVPWTVDFAQIGGAPFIAGERTTHSFSLERHDYDGASVTMENIVAGKIPYAARYQAFATNSITGMPPLVEP